MLTNIFSQNDGKYFEYTLIRLKCLAYSPLSCTEMNISIYFFKKHRKLIKSISVHFKKQLVMKSFINDILLNDCHYTKWDFCCKLQSQYARNGTLWKYSVMHIWIDIIKYNEEIKISAINFVQLKCRKKKWNRIWRKFSSFNLSVVVFMLWIL